MKKLKAILFSFLLVMIPMLSSCGNKTEKFDITFVVESGVYAIIETTGNEELELPKNPTKEHYIFKGWFFDKDVWENKFDKNSFKDKSLTEDVVVYAKFEVDENAVFETNILLEGFTKLDSKIFEIAVSNTTEDLYFSDCIQIDEESTWKLCTDISGNNLINSKVASLEVGDNKYYILVTDKKDNVKMYTVNIRRRWIYTVIFEDYDGMQLSSQRVEEDSIIVDAPVSSLRVGYTFDSWDYDISLPIKSNLVIKPIYKQNEYKIVYHYDGVDSRPVKTQVVTFDESVTLKNDIFVNNGYELTSWNTRSDGFGQLYNTNQTISKYKRINDLHLYADWSVITYSIEYHYDGGIKTNSIFNYTIEDNNIFLVETSKRHYSFVGWYTEPTFENKVTKILNGSFGNFNLYAKFTPINYTITYHNCSGVINSNTTQYTIEDSINLKDVYREGYEFVGWYEKSNFSGNKIVNISNMGDDLDLYAYFWNSENIILKGDKYFSGIENIIEGNNSLVSADDIPLSSNYYYKDNDFESTSKTTEKYVIASGNTKPNIYYLQARDATGTQSFIDNARGKGIDVDKRVVFDNDGSIKQNLEKYPLLYRLITPADGDDYMEQYITYYKYEAIPYQTLADGNYQVFVLDTNGITADEQATYDFMYLDVITDKNDIDSTYVNLPAPNGTSTETSYTLGLHDQYFIKVLGVSPTSENSSTTTDTGNITRFKNIISQFTDASGNSTLYLKYKEAENKHVYIQTEEKSSFETKYPTYQYKDYVKTADFANMSEDELEEYYLVESSSYANYYKADFKLYFKYNKNFYYESVQDGYEDGLYEIMERKPNIPLEKDILSGKNRIYIVVDSAKYEDEKDNEVYKNLNYTVIPSKQIDGVANFYNYKDYITIEKSDANYNENFKLYYKYDSSAENIYVKNTITGKNALFVIDDSVTSSDKSTYKDGGRNFIVITTKEYEANHKFFTQLTSDDEFYNLKYTLYYKYNAINETERVIYEKTTGNTIYEKFSPLDDDYIETDYELISSSDDNYVEGLELYYKKIRKYKKIKVDSNNYYSFGNNIKKDLTQNNYYVLTFSVTTSGNIDTSIYLKNSMNDTDLFQIENVETSGEIKKYSLFIKIESIAYVDICVLAYIGDKDSIKGNQNNESISGTIKFSDMELKLISKIDYDNKTIDYEVLEGAEINSVVI